MADDFNYTPRKEEHEKGFSIDGFIILALAIGIPIFIFGMTAALKFIQFMNSPIVEGSLPIWVVAVGIIVFSLIWQKFR